MCSKDKFRAKQAAAANLVWASTLENLATKLITVKILYEFREDDMKTMKPDLVRSIWHKPLHSIVRAVELKDVFGDHIRFFQRESD